MGLRQRGSVIGNYVTASSNSASGIWTGKEAYTLQKKGTWQVPPTFTLSSSAGTVNEGASVNFTLTTTGIPNGTVIPYTLSGTNVTTTDSANNILTGNFVIQNGTNTVSFNANADVTLEGTEIIQMVAAGKTANVTINDTSYPTDAQFPYTTLLLHGDGTNNAQNNTFLDSSTNNATITRNGNPTQGTFSPYGANWSNYFDGSGQAFYNSSFSGANFGESNNFTIEMWVLWNAAAAGNNTIFELTGTTRMIIGRSTTGIRYYNHVTERGYTVTVPIGVWNHIAIVRNSGTISVYLNGVQGTSFADNYNWAHTQFYTSRNSDGVELSSAFYMSNLRVVNGTAVYTTNFTPPTSPLTAISNTTLLLCQSNGFKDNSTNNFPLSILGTPSLQRFSPFSPTSAYSPSIYGGSAYYDGSGDYLTVPYNSVLNLGSDTTWTMEYWVYFNAAFGTYTPISFVQSGLIRWGIEHAASTTLLLFNNSTAVTFTNPTTLTPSTWYHIAWVRDGTTVRMYINGVASSTTSTNNLQSISSGPLNIGYNALGGYEFYMNGYITDVRLVKGTSVYTSAFTPPSAPIITSGSSAPYASAANVNTTFAAANTALLCNFTNAGIYDNTMISNFETIDGAKLSTSISKFGGSSMFFDGAGDYISLKNPQYNHTFFASQWTIETWVYPTSTSTTQTIFMQYGNSVDVIKLYFNGSSGAVSYQLRGTNQSLISADSAGSLISLNTWSHIVMVRDSTTTIKIFVNGTLALTATIASTTTFNEGGSSLYAEAPVIGAKLNSTTDYYVGYMDDFRITKGYARYTTNFTPPTLAHGDK